MKIVQEGNMGGNVAMKIMRVLNVQIYTNVTMKSEECVNLQTGHLVVARRIISVESVQRHIGHLVPRNKTPPVL